jgi:ABC-type multidrug transport system fused ATPase/permease subunit
VLILHNGRIVEHGLRTTLISDTNSLFAGLVKRGLQEELA